MLLLAALVLFYQDEEGRGAAVFFHSAAHVLGQALERTLGGQLTVGPALKEGFYYDCYMGQDTITEDKTYGPLQKCISAVVKVSFVEAAVLLAGWLAAI